MKLLTLFLALTLACIFYLFYLTAGLANNIQILQTYEPPKRTDDLTIIENQLQKIKEKQQEILDIFSSADTYTITAYAPTDPNAIEGMCYSGNPNETASGGRPIPYKTVAADTRFKFGQKLWIEGVGVVTVNDRGGMIQGDRLDLVLPSRELALKWGVQELKGVVLSD